jgi:hypothetical protein
MNSYGMNRACALHLLVVFAAVSPVAPLFGDPIADPGITSGDHCTYRSVLLDSDDIFYQSLDLEPSEMEGKRFYDFTMSLHWPDGQITEARSRLEADGHVRSVSTSRIDWSKEKRELLREEIHFKGSTSRYPEDTYSNFAIFFAMRGLARAKGKNDSIYMSIPSGVLSRLTLRCAGGKWVTVPAGRFRCVKVTARTDLDYFVGSLGGFLNYIGYFFIPKSTLWYMEDPPYLLVKYRGLVLVSPRNKPVEMELLKWSRIPEWEQIPEGEQIREGEQKRLDP